ncbi:hypothetical protein QYQ99_04720 [Comamonas testosteroni]|uniref:hypothetical protein n=1 Tax=Comamonas testosteroni TaxID=285 RepID=UPI00265F8966|nr:hypothetical protein [Comamonas testosteroni]WKL16839.1 hypothetical protein QYQ99_04720 [Comamonas testosteroni]
MEFIGLIILAYIVYYIYRKNKIRISNRNFYESEQGRSVNSFEENLKKSSIKNCDAISRGDDWEARDYKIPIPKGMQIYENFMVAGSNYKKSNIRNFFDSGSQSTKIEKDHENEHDSYAIKIIGVSNQNKYDLGFIPKDTAKKIHITNFSEKIITRLNRIFIGKSGYCEVYVQILGPKSEISIYRQYEEDKPATKENVEYLKFFKIKFNKNITNSEAVDLIKDHKNNSSPVDLAEWDLLNNIYDDFVDSGEYKEYNLKKPSKANLRECIDTLKKAGYKYEDIDCDFDLLAENLLRVNPNLKAQRG